MPKLLKEQFACRLMMAHLVCLAAVCPRSLSAAAGHQCVEPQREQLPCFARRWALLALLQTLPPLLGEVQGYRASVISRVRAQRKRSSIAISRQVMMCIVLR